MSVDFYRDLPGFSSFAEATDARHYRPAPEDWHVVVTDVKGSTKAIEAGRYRDVNMAGAACITAAVNACKGAQIPYVFGGDGATLLVPPEYLETMKAALLSVKHAARAMHGLELRVGAVPVREILARDKTLEVAKYILSTGCALAMFRGGGAALADRLVKEEGFEFQEEQTHTPDLTGLSCRWQPIAARRDVILTLLVLADDSATYEDINRFIEQMLESDAAPVGEKSLRYSWPGWELLRRSQMVWRRGNVVKHLFGHLFMTAWFNVLNRYNIRLGSLFDVRQYRRDMIVNSDYRKFDDMLRMVADCTRVQAGKIEEYLDRLHQAGRIAYGTHYSDTALMTCFVTGTESSGHVHFIDGNHGGYALAAKQLKAQRKGMVSGEKASSVTVDETRRQFIKTAIPGAALANQNQH